jgi:hypothetical protein
MSDLRTSLRIASGVIVWAAHFAVIYGATGLACARDAAERVPWTVAAATLVAGAIAASIFVREWRLRASFNSWLAATIAAIALLAIVWEGITVLIVPPCV